MKIVDNKLQEYPLEELDNTPILELDLASEEILKKYNLDGSKIRITRSLALSQVYQRRYIEMAKRT